MISQPTHELLLEVSGLMNLQAGGPLGVQEMFRVKTTLRPPLTVPDTAAAQHCRTAKASRRLFFPVKPGRAVLRHQQWGHLAGAVRRIRGHLASSMWPLPRGTVGRPIKPLVRADPPTGTSRLGSGRPGLRVHLPCRLRPRRTKPMVIAARCSAERSL